MTAKKTLPPLSFKRLFDPKGPAIDLSEVKLLNLDRLFDSDAPLSFVRTPKAPR